jgi:acetyl-CoA carboxylase biotin carboxyl carrier protein
MKILNDTNLTEISFESEDLKIMVKRPKLVPAIPKGIKEAKVETKAEKNYKEIKSYHIGNFSYYDKNMKPLIKVGENVKEGQLIGSVSTMGVSSPIIASYTGTVKEILVENGSIADYGKTLVLIDLD